MQIFYPMASVAAGWEQLKAGRHRAVFYRAWHAAFHAGLSHTQAMNAMGAQPLSVEPARQAVLTAANRRASVAAAIRSAPAAFEPFEAGLLVAGEEGGTLEQSLRELARHFTAKDRLMQWVMKQMTYPLMTALAACFIAPFPILFFGNAPLYLLLSLGSAIGLVLSGGRFVGAVAERYAKRPPLVLARLARALATALASGLPLDRVTSLAALASGSEAIVRHVEAQPVHQRATQTLGETFAGAPGITHDFEAMLRVGDATGDYTASVGKLADLLEDGFR